MTLQPATGVTHTSKFIGGQDARWSRALRSVGPTRSARDSVRQVRFVKVRTRLRFIGRFGKARRVSSPRLERIPTGRCALAQPSFQTKHTENCVVRMRRTYIAKSSVPNDIGGAESTDRRTGRHDIMQTVRSPGLSHTAETATAPSSKPRMGAHLGYMAERQPRCRQRRESLGQEQRRSTSTCDICNPQAVRESSIVDAACTTPVRRESQSPPSGIGGHGSSSARPSSVT